MDWKDLPPDLAGPENVIFPKQLNSKKTPDMTQEELQAFIVATFGGPGDFHAVMNAIADEQELGNNADPIQPEDCDTDSVHNE